MRNLKMQKIFYFALTLIIAMTLILNTSAAMIMAVDNSTLQEQINNAQEGATITLTKDYSEAIVVSNQKTITIDLNGFTLSSPTTTVITNNGTLTIKDSGTTGKITKSNQDGDVTGIHNNSNLTIMSGTVAVTTVNSGVSHGVYNTGSFTMSNGTITSVTTGSQWAFGIYNNGGTIENISGGTIKGQIDKKTGNGYNALGISNEANATIKLISGGVISAEVNNNGKAWGIRNRGVINEISGGTITAKTTGTEWAFGVWNTDNGRINKISGGLFSGYIDNPGNGNNALGISNHENGTPTIDLVSGGVFIGQTNGSGSGFGLRSDGVVTNITGGAYRGNNSDNALVKRQGTLNIGAGYVLTNGTFFRYVIPTNGFYVDLVDEQEKWVASYTFNAQGELTASLGENLQNTYTVFNWNNNQAEKTVECDADDFGDFGANTTLYVKTTDKPVYYFLGSSVTYGHTTGGVSFVDYLAQDNDWITIKKAVSGTTLVDNGPDSYIQRMKNQIGVNAGMDHFICQLSTNDATQQKPMGTVSTSKNINDFNKTTIIGAMEYIIAYAYENWDCPVTFYTNPYYNNSYYEQMIDALYDLQKKWDIGIIDFYYYRNMDKLSSSTLGSYMSDSIHPNSNGYRWMAGVMSELLTSDGNTDNPQTSPTPTNPTPGSQPNTGDNSLAVMLLLLSISGTLVIVYVCRMKRSHN